MMRSPEITAARHSRVGSVRRASTKPARAAFTFLELMMVLFITGIMLAAAVPRYNIALFQFRVDAASKRIAADITFAQRQALTLSTSQNLVFVTSAGPGTVNSYSMPNVKYVEFAATGTIVNLNLDPYKAAISSATFGGGSTLAFDRYGTPNFGGTVVVQAGGYSKTVSVDASTGRVTIL